jgi:hypothetical protein
MIVSTRTDEEGKYTLKGFIVSDETLDIRIEARPDNPSAFRGGFGSIGHRISTLKPGETETGLNFRITMRNGAMIMETERE